MDSSLYKSTTTSRGLHYNYYASPAQPGKQTLFFCHGFPGTARDWRYIVPFFQERGFGIIAPDMIGYGGTDKPTDPALYVSSLVTRDLVDIMDAEHVDQAIAIGHDWGSKTVSRFANYFPDRFVAYAFFAAAYLPPVDPVPFEDFLAFVKSINGYETYGYWLFFSEEGADTILKDHIDAMISILYPHDPLLWRTHIGPRGAMKAAILEDFKGPLPEYMTQEDVETWKSIFLKNGFTGPLCWYKIMTSGLEPLDDQKIPAERAFPPKTSPVFFGGASKDYICNANIGQAVFTSPAFKDHDVTFASFDADHWVIISKPEEICQKLESWIRTSVTKEASS